MRKYISDEQTKGYLITLCAAIAFSLYPAGSRLAYSHGTNPTFLILITTTLRTSALIIAALIKGTSPAQIAVGIPASYGAGVFQAITIVGIIWSLNYISGPVMITVIFTHTLMLLGILYARGEAHPSRLAIGTSIVALIGIALVVDLFNNLSGCDWRGLMLAFIAALGSATRLYAYGKQVETEAPEVVGARAYVVASLCLLVLLVFDAPRVPVDLVGAVGVALACVSMVIGTLCFFWALKRIGSFRTSLMLKSEPVLTCIVSWLILGETLGTTQYVGIALVLGSLIVYQVRS